MSKQETLVPWVFEAVKAEGGKASVEQVAKYIWENHRDDLDKNGMLYTWQYDMRWTAQKLRKEKRFVSTSAQASRMWEIAR